jgi:hypothetical protein
MPTSRASRVRSFNGPPLPHDAIERREGAGAIRAALAVEENGPSGRVVDDLEEAGHRLLWQVTAEPPEAHWNLDRGHAQRFDQRALIGGGTEADHRADAEVAQLHEAWPVRWSRCDFEAPP